MLLPDTACLQCGEPGVACQDCLDEGLELADSPIYRCQTCLKRHQHKIHEAKFALDLDL